jgi:hypothetical protein
MAGSFDAVAPRLTTAVGDVVIGTLLATARRSHGDLEVIRALARAERATAGCFPVF